jgi:DNA gyrase/topoisomerase IV subunit B
MKTIRVTVTNDRISIENDGQGIPVVMHYIPVLKIHH